MIDMEEGGTLLKRTERGGNKMEKALKSRSGYGKTVQCLRRIQNHKENARIMLPAHNKVKKLQQIALERRPNTC